MTHAELVQMGVKWLRGSHHKCTIVFAELSTRLPVTPDLLGFNYGGHVTHVEVKMSRSDFRADAKKISHRFPERYLLGDTRWYLAPDGCLRAEDMPEGWGLAVARGKRIYIVKQAPVSKERRRSVEVEFLVSALRRHELGIEWRHEEAKFAPYKRPKPRNRK